MNRATATLGRWHEEFRRTNYRYMVVVALIIGLAGGLCAVGFRKLIEVLQLLAWSQNHDLVEHIRALPWYWKVGAPGLGGLIVGLITYYTAREAKGHGVPEVMEAVALRSSRIRPRVVIAKMFASAITIASGGSVGREGPIVQIGSALGSTIGQWLRVNERRLRTMVGCGAAAGIAATFNAPVAGALFSLEIILGEFTVSRFSPIVISSVTATVVSRHFLGDVPAFEVPGYSLASPLELIAYAGLGLVAGLVALLFVNTLYRVEDIFDSINLYPPLKTLGGGVIIGVMALALPEILGVGYESINRALSGNMVLWFLALLIVAKILAVSITIGSGGSGGIFAPSLFIGAMTGGVMGVAVNHLWPGSVAAVGAYSLVGMAAVVAAATHAPITAILIVFELTNDYKIILPLMISCIIATILAMRLQDHSIYTLKLIRRGVDLRKGRSVDMLQNLPVSRIMRREFAAVNLDAPLMSIISRFVEQSVNTVFVLDRSGRLAGVVTLDEIRYLMSDAQALESLAIAKDIMTERGFPVFKPDDSLAEVMKRLAGHVHEAPVIDDGRIVGCIWPDDVIRQYNAEVFKRDMASGMTTMLDDAATAYVPGSADLRLVQAPVPPHFVGRSISELDIRKRFGISVLMIKRREEGREESVDAAPAPDTVLRDGDVLLLMGPEAQVRRFEGE